ncbi:putative hydrolase YxeP [Abditibacteriota bacterium]|nr:putative hydrolase YxeP [Abditibacteriota bacterium]
MAKVLSRKLSAMTFAPELLAKTVVPSLDLPWEHDAIALRRDFHEHPELGFEEVRSASIVAQRLRALGMEVREGVGKTGVIGLLRGEAGDGPCVLVRADMDALPIEEANDWEWKSGNKGAMHACGHDAHMAIGLSVARLLAEQKATLRGSVKFMFQPAEEGLGGADKMIEDGVLSDPKPDFALALHVWTPIEKGKIGVAAGPVMACADEFRARIIGKGGHGAMPEQTVDAVLMAAHTVVALQSIVSRNVKPLESGVVTVGKIESGTAFNVIPGEAILAGTTRAFSNDVRALLEKRVREIIATMPPVFGGQGELTWITGFPAVVNDAEVVERLKPAFEKVAGEGNVIEFEPTLGAEDMSVVLRQIPGCYFFIGGRNGEIDAIYPHHHPKFNIDESAIILGTNAMVEATKTLLG